MSFQSAIAAVKRVGLTLISANPAYAPCRFTSPELADIRVAGRVVAIYHKV
jgi:phage repressor protein C with HTH and peptisase S24 domain